MRFLSIQFNPRYEPGGTENFWKINYNMENSDKQALFLYNNNDGEEGKMLDKGPKEKLGSTNLSDWKDRTLTNCRELWSRKQ